MYYPNRFGHLYLKAIDDIIGKSGCDALLHMAGVSQRPPDNLVREFSVEAFAAINVGFREMAGKRLGGGLANRAGRANLSQVVQHTDFFGMGRDDLQALQGAEQVAALLRPLSLFSDEAPFDIDAQEGFLLVTARLCPACWGHESEVPVCNGVVGWLAESLRWMTGHEPLVEEIACRATPDVDNCVFRVEMEG